VTNLEEVPWNGCGSCSEQELFVDGVI
jgi:hypothetical protein